MMFWDGTLEVRTPSAVFALVHSLSRATPSGRRVATPDETERAWFFFRTRLEFPHWSALGPVLDLYAALTGERLMLRGNTDDLILIRRVLEAFEQALRVGRLRFEAVPQPEGSPGTQLEYVGLEPGVRPPSAQRLPQQEARTWFEVKVLDELGEPLDGQGVEFTVAGERFSQGTNARGLARIYDAPKTFGSARFANTDLVRQALHLRWTLVRGRDWIEPEPGSDVLSVRRLEPLPSIFVEYERTRTIYLRPRVVRARLFGMWFETAKCFLLPTARATLPELRSLYDQNANTSLLIVGHTDRTGKPSYNDPLSFERAEAVRAFLADDVEAWYAWYSDRKPYKKRWGSHEDALMIQALGCPPGADPVTWYQEQHDGLEVDGKAGTKTRHKLIGEYMALDGTHLPSTITATSHGCGENFPLIETADAAAEQQNRRVELFFFDGPVLPPPRGRNSAPSSHEYPEWVRRAKETHDFDTEHPAGGEIRIRLHDQAAKPMTQVPYRLTIRGQRQPPAKAATGWIILELPASTVANTVTIEWGEPQMDGSYQYERDIVLTHHGDERQQAAARLSNLGYASTSDAEYETAVRCFQEHYEIPESGLSGSALPPATKAKLASIFETDCNASPPTSVVTPSPSETAVSSGA